jgi:GDP-L-fucose synthase
MATLESPYKKILVTGATGFLGNHITPALREQLDGEVVAVSSSDYNLMNEDQTNQMLDDIQPDAVVHLAAKSGGIIANRDYPADFFFENLIMNMHVFQASYRKGVKKFLTLIGGCSYPAQAPSPIREEMMWDGFPQKESAAYSTAKKILLIQSEAYRRQHGFNSVVLVPGNVYGEHDNFRENYSHVIPALIRRFIEAREKGIESVTCFGSGTPTRDFVYAGDVAATIPWFLTNYDSSEHVNISTGTSIAIRELAETIQSATGYQGTINWDTSQPDGQQDKIFSVDKLNALGLSCPTSLADGLQKTVDWFLEVRDSGAIRL